MSPTPTPRTIFVSERSDDQEAARNELLQIICAEIARDGGASLVTTLKDYITPKILPKKRFRSLLIAAIGIPKLLTLLEAFPDVFHVVRNSNPHWVQLLKQDFVNHSELEVNYDDCDSKTLKSKQRNDLSQQQQQQQQQQLVVYNKALYILRKRKSKLDRRKQRCESNNPYVGNAGEPEDNCYDDDEFKVNTFWLLQQCKWDVHFYLRTTGFYKKVYSKPEDVQRLGSLGWEKIALHEFESILSSTFDQVQQQPASTIVVENSKAWLKSHFLPVSSQQGEISIDDNNAPGDERSGDIEQTDCHIEYLRKLDQILTKAVDEDGSIQIRLELLLHRHEALKKILGGRDLWRIIQDYHREQQNDKTAFNNVNRTLFQNIDIQKQGSDTLLKSTTIDKMNIGGRMKVDEVGLFSITNSKWGTAVANMMIQSVHKVGWICPKKIVQDLKEGGSETTSATATATSSITAIDLTASVGGMTLALAKTNFFHPIIAIEIDPGRATLCQENMIQHGFTQDVVEVRSMDSMDAIPTLPSRSCIVLDPPWGGINYNKIQRENMKNVVSNKQQMVFQMGKWTLEDIVEKISIHLSPCIVGIRLPITLIVDDFLDNLRNNRNLLFDTLFARKLSVQIFVVIYLRGEDEEGV